MLIKSRKEKVDQLIGHLWKEGYLTLSRKYGKYLPPPPKIFGYEVDAISKSKKKIAIGLTISENEINENLVKRVSSILKFKNINRENRITLFIGIPSNSIINANVLFSSLDAEEQKSIKIIPLEKTNQ